MKYCLYSRKPTEQEERQVLSIDSQIKEMLGIAEKEGLEVVEIRRETSSLGMAHLPSTSTMAAPEGKIGTAKTSTSKSKI